ncbi:MAG: 6-phosphogluconolactonase, partial [Candidatus Omnitrophica bacterium]|nr:6-phosphogluconolactonase [Candidatus Omnitrophota bacterium]
MIQENERIVKMLNDEGLNVHYYSLAEQKIIIQMLGKGAVRKFNKNEYDLYSEDPFSMGGKGLAAIREMMIEIAKKETVGASHEDIIWFLDDDLELNQLFLRLDGRKDKQALIDPFSEFEKIFNTTNALYVAGNYTSDSPKDSTYPNSFLQLLMDLGFFLDWASNGKAVDKIPRTYDTREFKRSNIKKDRYKTKQPVRFPLLGKDENRLLGDTLIEYLESLLGIFYGNYPTRPIIYGAPSFQLDENGKICNYLEFKAGPHGNLAFRKSVLEMPMSYFKVGEEFRAEGLLRLKLFSHFIKGSVVTCLIPANHNRQKVHRFNVDVTDSNLVSFHKRVTENIQSIMATQLVMGSVDLMNIRSLAEFSELHEMHGLKESFRNIAIMKLVPFIKDTIDEIELIKILTNSMIEKKYSSDEKYWWNQNNRYANAIRTLEVFLLSTKQTFERNNFNAKNLNGMVEVVVDQALKTFGVNEENNDSSNLKSLNTFEVISCLFTKIFEWFNQQFQQPKRMGGLSEKIPGEVLGFIYLALGEMMCKGMHLLSIILPAVALSVVLKKHEKDILFSDGLQKEFARSFLYFPSRTPSAVVLTGWNSLGTGLLGLNTADNKSSSNLESLRLLKRIISIVAVTTTFLFPVAITQDYSWLAGLFHAPPVDGGYWLLFMIPVIFLSPLFFFGLSGEPPRNNVFRHGTFQNISTVILNNESLALEGGAYFFDRIKSALKNTSSRDIHVGLTGGHSFQGIYHWIVINHKTLNPQEWARLRFWLTNSAQEAISGQTDAHIIVYNHFIQPLVRKNVIRADQYEDIDLNDGDINEKVKKYNSNKIEQLSNAGYDLLFLGESNEEWVAGLEPGSQGLTEKNQAFILHNTSAGPWASDTLPTIRNSQNILIVLNGQNKCRASVRLLRASGDVIQSPARIIYEITQDQQALILLEHNALEWPSFEIQINGGDTVKLYSNREINFESDRGKTVVLGIHGWASQGTYQNLLAADWGEDIVFVTYDRLDVPKHLIGKEHIHFQTLQLEEIKKYLAGQGLNVAVEFRHSLGHELGNYVSRNLDESDDFAFSREHTSLIVLANPFVSKNVVHATITIFEEVIKKAVPGYLKFGSPILLEPFITFLKEDYLSIKQKQNVIMKLTGLLRYLMGVLKPIEKQIMQRMAEVIWEREGIPLEFRGPIRKAFENVPIDQFIRELHAVLVTSLDDPAVTMNEFGALKKVHFMLFYSKRDTVAVLDDEALQAFEQLDEITIHDMTISWADGFLEHMKPLDQADEIVDKIIAKIHDLKSRQHLYANACIKILKILRNVFAEKGVNYERLKAELISEGVLINLKGKVVFDDGVLRSLTGPVKTLEQNEWILVLLQTRTGREVGNMCLAVHDGYLWIISVNFYALPREGILSQLLPYIVQFYKEKPLIKITEAEQSGMIGAIRKGFYVDDIERYMYRNILGHISQRVGLPEMTYADLSGFKGDVIPRHVYSIATRRPQGLKDMTTRFVGDGTINQRNKKLVIIDLVGTILESPESEFVFGKCIEAIDQLRRLGVEIAILTGESTGLFQKVYPRLLWSEGIYVGSGATSRMKQIHGEELIPLYHLTFHQFQDSIPNKRTPLLSESEITGLIQEVKNVANGMSVTYLSQWQNISRLRIDLPQKMPQAELDALTIQLYKSLAPYNKKIPRELQKMGVRFQIFYARQNSRIIITLVNKKFGAEYLLRHLGDVQKATDVLAIGNSFGSYAFWRAGGDTALTNIYLKGRPIITVDVSGQTLPGMFRENNVFEYPHPKPGPLAAAAVLEDIYTRLKNIEPRTVDETRRHAFFKEKSRRMTGEKQNPLRILTAAFQQQADKGIALQAENLSQTALKLLEQLPAYQANPAFKMEETVVIKKTSDGDAYFVDFYLSDNERIRTVMAFRSGIYNHLFERTRRILKIIGLPVYATAVGEQDVAFYERIDGTPLHEVNLRDKDHSFIEKFYHSLGSILRLAMIHPNTYMLPDQNALTHLDDYIVAPDGTIRGIDLGEHNAWLVLLSLPVKVSEIKEYIDQETMQLLDFFIGPFSQQIGAYELFEKYDVYPWLKAGFLQMSEVIKNKQKHIYHVLAEDPVLQQEMKRVHRKKQDIKFFIEILAADGRQFLKDILGQHKQINRQDQNEFWGERFGEFNDAIRGPKTWTFTGQTEFQSKVKSFDPLINKIYLAIDALQMYGKSFNRFMTKAYLIDGLEEPLIFPDIDGRPFIYRLRKLDNRNYELHVVNKSGDAWDLTFKYKKGKFLDIKIRRSAHHIPMNHLEKTHRTALFSLNLQVIYSASRLYS